MFVGAEEEAASECGWLHIAEVAGVGGTRARDGRVG